VAARDFLQVDLPLLPYGFERGVQTAAPTPVFVDPNTLRALEQAEGIIVPDAAGSASVAGPAKTTPATALDEENLLRPLRLRLWTPHPGFDVATPVVVGNGDSETQ